MEQQMDLEFNPQKKVEITPEIFEDVMMAADKIIADIKYEETEGFQYHVDMDQIYLIKIHQHSIEISKRHNLKSSDVFEMISKELERRGKLKKELA